LPWDLCGELVVVVCGLWFVVCGLWFVVCGLWFVVCGLWFVVCETTPNEKMSLGGLMRVPLVMTCHKEGGGENKVRKRMYLRV
jgi:hypothetical protein